MKPAPFTLVRPGSLEEAVAVLAGHAGDAKVIAGGQSLVPLMNFRLSRPEVLVDITALPGLDTIEVVLDDDRQGAGGGRVRLGALVTHRQVESCAELADHPTGRLLPLAARHIGHLPIRTQGTVGGSLAHADAAAEWPLVATLFDATVTLWGPAGERRVPVSSFFTGFLSTAAGPDEILTAVEMPLPPGTVALGEFARRRGDFALVSVAAHAHVVDGVVASVGVAAGGVGTAPVRFGEVEASLVGREAADVDPDAVAAALAASVDPVGDLHADPEVRRALLRALAGDALAEVLGRG